MRATPSGTPAFFAQSSGSKGHGTCGLCRPSAKKKPFCALSIVSSSSSEEVASSKAAPGPDAIAHLVTRLAKPPTLHLVSPAALAMPEAITEELARSCVKVECSERLDESLPVSDVLYVTRVQKERFASLERMMQTILAAHEGGGGTGGTGGVPSLSRAC